MGDEEMKNICEFCGKSFKGVRALCGHKRWHNSSAKRSVKRGLKKFEFDLGFEDNDEKSFEFGENLEKNGGFSCFCKKCGHVFENFRGLNGHMRSHSKKKSGRCSVKTGLKLLNPPREKRSLRRYKINTCSANFSFGCNWNEFGYRKNSCVSVVDEEELMEIASCLLMLSDSVSVDSEMLTQQCDVDVEPSCMEAVNVDDSGANFDVLSSGIVSVEDEVAVNFLRFSSDVCENRLQNVECGHVFGVEHESEMCVTGTKDEITEIPQEGLIFGGVVESDTCVRAPGERKLEFAGVSLSTSDQTQGNNSRLKHFCKVCEKGFPSGQALGGHRTQCPRSRMSEMDIHCKPAASQKSGSKCVKLGGDHGEKGKRRYICFVCSKEFGSGQALGGHMRAHFQNHDPQSFEKKSDAFDHGIPEDANEEVSLHPVPRPLTVPALLPVA